MVVKLPRSVGRKDSEFMHLFCGPVDIDAHVAAARELIGSGQPAGRKLEFLAQEFNREANTTCSKAADIEISRIGLELKSVIDQLREQVQNIE